MRSAIFSRLAISLFDKFSSSESSTSCSRRLRFVTESVFSRRPCPVRIESTNPDSTDRGTQNPPAATSGSARTSWSRASTYVSNPFTPKRSSEKLFASLCCSPTTISRDSGQRSSRFVSSAPVAGLAAWASTTYTLAFGGSSARRSGASVDSSCFKITLNCDFASNRSNSLSTSGCGESMQTVSLELALFVATFSSLGENCTNGQVPRKPMFSNCY